MNSAIFLRYRPSRYSCPCSMRRCGRSLLWTPIIYITQSADANVCAHPNRQCRDIGGMRRMVDGHSRWTYVWPHVEAAVDKWWKRESRCLGATVPNNQDMSTHTWLPNAPPWSNTILHLWTVNFPFTHFPLLKPVAHQCAETMATSQNRATPSEEHKKPFNKESSRSTTTRGMQRPNKCPAALYPSP